MSMTHRLGLYAFSVDVSVNNVIFHAKVIPKNRELADLQAVVGIGTQQLPPSLVPAKTVMFGDVL